MIIKPHFKDYIESLKYTKADKAFITNALKRVELDFTQEPSENYTQTKEQLESIKSTQLQDLNSFKKQQASELKAFKKQQAKALKDFISAQDNETKSLTKSLEKFETSEEINALKIAINDIVSMFNISKAKDEPKQQNQTLENNTSAPVNNTDNIQVDLPINNNNEDVVFNQTSSIQ